MSINHLITLALAEKVSALMTAEYLQERARRGDRERFERAMAWVPDAEPEGQDRLSQPARWTEESSYREAQREPSVPLDGPALEAEMPRDGGSQPAQR